MPRSDAQDGPGSSALPQRVATAGGDGRSAAGNGSASASAPGAGGVVLHPPASGAALAVALVRLARPKQWAKSAFVLVGPMYALAEGKALDWVGLIGAVAAFCLASSACYVVNDLQDREADRAHPRKRRRPIASGLVTPAVARVYACVLLLASAGAVALAPMAQLPWLALAVGLYVVNVMGYSAGLKRLVIVDVICLALGFVLRVLGGCAAAGVEPSTWLLNCTFFVSMFLAFGKRLGERRTLGEAASVGRGVQGEYTDDLLRMAVVVTAVGTLVTYAGYVQAHDAAYTLGFNLLWLTILPATYGLLRCIVLLERGVFDDPTELAAHDRPFQAGIVLFGLITAGVVMRSHLAGA